MGIHLVIKPLCENSGHTKILCSRLGLGVPGRELCKVSGGFHHKMWRLDTDRGRYAIKQLSTDADMGDPGTVEHYNVTEAIGEAFASHDIGAIFALKWHANYLQVIEDVGYLVYSWTSAVGLPSNEISAKHALKIARILARMHLADIQMPQVKDAQLEIFTEEKMVSLVNRAIECNARHATVLDEQLPDFLRILDSRRAAIRTLGDRTVISHGDMDQTNVLWSASGDPILIDWESARRLNPTYEIVLEALEWSGIATTFQHGLFDRMISAYTHAGGAIDSDSMRASFHSILGDWLDWLMFNVGRSVDLEDDEQRLIGANQVDLALAAILRLEHLLPNLLQAGNS